MTVPTPLLPNDLAYSVAETCRKWAYTSYSAVSDVTEAPRNPNVERQYETRLDRAISETQTKIQVQRRALDEVSHLIAFLRIVAKETTG
jgi:hypothetical protein